MSEPDLLFVLEQTLGHVTHADNIRRLAGARHDVTARFVDVEYPVTGAASKVPWYGNWTVRAGLRARRLVRAARRERPVDAMFVHTQVPAVLNPDLLARIPTVVSLDATPIQYDELGAHYAHDTSGPRVEHLKWRANVACFRRAEHVVTWSAWAKQGLVDRYEVPADKISVVPPGVDPGIWARPDGSARAAAPDPGDSVRILFVGGDLRRKGGDDLIAAYREVRAAAAAPVELHLVTRDDVPDEPGVVVHHGLSPNSPELIALYHRSHVFCLPTHGDCLPMVLSEAGAAELPLVSTAVGAIPEIVRDEETGFVVPPGDVSSLTDRLRRLVDDAPRREQMGRRAAELVTAAYDAERNVSALVDLLVEVAGRRS